jgi:hypothetical protein
MYSENDSCKLIFSKLNSLADIEFHDDHGMQSKKNKKKKGKIISRLANKGNFSDFRNKSFVPNAARLAKKQSRQQGVSEQKSLDSDNEIEDIEYKFQSLVTNKLSDDDEDDDGNDSADAESNDDKEDLVSNDDSLESQDEA